MADKKTIQEEKELISACIQGDKASWDKFIIQYHELIYNEIYKILVLGDWTQDPYLVDDLYQEIFHALHRDDYKKLRQFEWKNNCSFATWLSIITKNTVIDFTRKESKRLSKLERLVLKSEAGQQENGSTLVENESKIIGKVESVLEELTALERKEIVHKALEKLPEEDRELLTLYYFRNTSHGDIAKILRKSVDAIYMQKKRALDKLKNILINLVGIEEFRRLL